MLRPAHEISRLGRISTKELTVPSFFPPEIRVFIPVGFYNTTTCHFFPPSDKNGNCNSRHSLSRCLPEKRKQDKMVSYTLREKATEEKNRPKKGFVTFESFAAACSEKILISTNAFVHFSKMKELPFVSTSKNGLMAATGEKTI